MVTATGVTRTFFFICIEPAVVDKALSSTPSLSRFVPVMLVMSLPALVALLVVVDLLKLKTP